MREPGGDTGYQKAMNKPGRPPVAVGIASQGLIGAAEMAAGLSGTLGLAICLSLHPAMVLAQDDEAGPTVTLEGEVLDAATGIPVKAAIVSVRGLDRSDVSDDLGYFRIERIPAGRYPVRVLRLGYQTLQQEVPIRGAETLSVYLMPRPRVSQGDRGGSAGPGRHRMERAGHFVTRRRDTGGDGPAAGTLHRPRGCPPRTSNAPGPLPEAEGYQ